MLKRKLPNPYAKPLATASYRVLLTSAFQIGGRRREAGELVDLAPVAAQHLVLAGIVEPAPLAAPAAASATVPAAPAHAPANPLTPVA